MIQTIMSTTVFDSAIFQNLYSTPAMRAIFSDTHLVETYLHIERTLAKVQGELGVIPQDAADQIQAKAQLDQIDWDRFLEKIPNVGVPIAPLVSQIVSAVGDAGQWVHYGATTQDIMDTAVVLQLREAIGLLEADLAQATDLLKKLAKKHQNTAMVGRSQLQQAIPITFGYKAAVWLSALQRHQERLNQLKPRLLVGQFSGAVGTLASLESAGLETQARLCAELGLAQPIISWHTARDSLAEFGSFLGLLTSTLGKIGLDLVLMAQTEVGEIAEPFAPGRGGSSTMPHKRNPISAQRMMVAGKLSKPYVATLLEAQMNDHERGAGVWPLEWAALPQLCLLAAGSLHETCFVLDGLRVFEDRMVKNLDLTNGLLLTEAIMMALAPKIGRKTAHDLLEELVHETVETGDPLLAIMQKNGQIGANLTPAELEALLDPANYTGLAAEMVDRVLSQ